jgi:sugar-specific transcriptional regulator TrmB
MELIEPLKKIGLEEKEAQVYLTLLRLNRATAYLVALRSGLKRTTVYAILDNLVSKGFALKTPNEKKTVYFAKSPQECFAEAREKIIEAEEYLPKLTALRKESKDDGGVSYYEGIDQVKEVYAKLLDEVSNDECIGFYGHLKEAPEILKKFTEDLDKDYISQKIKRRVIIADTESTRNYIENAHTLGVDVKPLPENLYDSNASIEVFKNKVIIFSHRDLKATLIENPDVAKVIKQIFEITWKTKQE